tara:strand:+ start:165 stop:944 length:780 start_codon:yes stop_codon:yes gene_type:complete
MFVAQVFYNGMTLPGSGSSPKNWWWASGIFFGLFLFLLMIDTATDGDSYDECMNDAYTWNEIEDCEDTSNDSSSAGFAVFGVGSCCFSVIAGIVALSIGNSKQTVIVQQMPQIYAPQPIIQQVIHQPVQQAPRGQMPIQQPPPTQQAPRGQMPMQTRPPKPTVNPQGFAQQAKNLEMARDFQGAADMFQKAGLFAEAGRVRQKFLEKEDKPVVQIGQVGNSVVQDSVIMGSSLQPNICNGCNSSIQPDWKFCPSCNAPI